MTAMNRLPSNERPGAALSSWAHPPRACQQGLQAAVLGPARGGCAQLDSAAPGRSFVGWLGSHMGFHQSGGGLHLDPTIQITISDKEISLRAIYLPDIGDTTQGR